jgi:hypothetical protein
MVTLQDFKKMASSNVASVSVDYNMQCSQIIDVIYDKVLEIMSKDKKVGIAKRTFIINSAKVGKKPIKEYIDSMPNNDARDVITKIELIIK